MSQTVLDAIELELVGLERLVPEPTGTLGYGNDLSNTGDLTEDLAEVDPFSAQAIGEATIRRLTTVRGGVLDDPDYGIDVRAYLNRGTPVAELRDLAGMCRLEALKDDRIEDITVTVTMPTPGSLRIEATITPADPRTQPFDLTFSASSGGVVVEAIG